MFSIHSCRLCVCSLHFYVGFLFNTVERFKFKHSIYLNRNEFSLPDLFKITKDNIIADERVKRFRSLTTFKNTDKRNSKNIKNSASISSGLSDQARKRATTSPRTNNNKNGIDNANFELYFNTNYPWQNVYIAENVEKSLEEVKIN